MLSRPLRRGDRMRRRRFLAMLGSAAVAPCFTAKAQHETRVWRIGYLYPGSHTPSVDAFVAGLHELGYVEGKNIKIDFWLAQGHIERMSGLARDLVQSRPDVI